MMKEDLKRRLWRHGEPIPVAVTGPHVSGSLAKKFLMTPVIVELIEDLSREARAGDQVWFYRSNPETWLGDAGQEGVCLVRNGRMVDSRLTLMS